MGVEGVVFEVVCLLVDGFLVAQPTEVSFVVLVLFRNLMMF